MYIAFNYLDYKTLILFKLKVFADEKSTAIETMGMVLVENIVKNALHSTMLLNQDLFGKGSRNAYIKCLVECLLKSIVHIYTCIVL